jgi:hypothetical protein
MEPITSSRLGTLRIVVFSLDLAITIAWSARAVPGDISDTAAHRKAFVRGKNFWEILNERDPIVAAGVELPRQRAWGALTEAIFSRCYWDKDRCRYETWRPQGHS